MVVHVRGVSVRGWLAHLLPLIQVLAGCAAIPLGTLQWWTAPLNAACVVAVVVVSALGHPRPCPRCTALAEAYQVRARRHLVTSRLYRVMSGRWWWLPAVALVVGVAAVLVAVATGDPWPASVAVAVLWWVIAAAQFVVLERAVETRWCELHGEER